MWNIFFPSVVDVFVWLLLFSTSFSYSAGITRASDGKLSFSRQTIFIIAAAAAAVTDNTTRPQTDAD